MRLFNGRLTAIVAGAVVLGLSALTQATTVTFYTVGTFGGASTAAGSTTTASQLVSASGPSYTQSSQVVVDGAGAGTSTLQFFNSSNFYQNYAPGQTTLPFSVEALDGPENVTFGYFNALSGDSTALNGVTFTLSIYQLNPSIGNASLAGTLTGSLKAFGSDVVLSFNPNVVYIPDPATGVKYVVDPTDGNITINRFGPSFLDGTVAVPLPAPAMAGMAALGVIGYARHRRKAGAESTAGQSAGACLA